MYGHIFRRNQARQAAAERHPGKHQHDHGRPRPLRREFIDQRHHDRQRTGKRNAGQNTDQHELVKRRGRDRRQREHAERIGAADNDALAAEAISEIAKERRPEEPGGERT